MLKFKKLDPLNGQKADRVVIFLHGYGANGLDLLDIGRYWSPQLAGAAFIAPDAPEPCEMGGGGFQWFSLRSYTPEAMREGADRSVKQLMDFISYVGEDYSVPAEKIAMVGFSQGTMMALHAAANYEEPLSGIIGYSGALLATNLSAFQQIPVLLVHGSSDPVVPMQASLQAYEELKAAGCPVDKLIIPGLQHGIDQQGLEKGREFLFSHPAN